MRNIILSFTLLALVIPTVHATAFSKRPEVQDFIETLELQPVEKRRALKALSQIESNAEVIQRITTPYEAMAWDKYKKHLVTEKRINEGVKFWKERAAILKRASEEFGIPEQIIIAIIGVESSYGQNRGKFLVLEALATLAFDYQPRAAFFKSELKQYLLLVNEQGLDPLELKGSYAGAMGSPQFISSSYRNFAVDFDKTGKIDLINNMDQAIGSVGNYFKVHGWKTGKPVAHKAQIRGNKFKTLPIAAGKDPRPILELGVLHKHGITTKAKINDPEATVALLEFDAGKEKEYWLGFNNFYVITRYNHSSNYALAVFLLSEAIAKAHAQGTPSKNG